MKYFTIYNKNTGEILRSGICTDPKTQVINITEAVIEAISIPGQSYVKNGMVIDYPNPAPENWFEWDLESETWVNLLTPDEQAEAEQQLLEVQFRMLRSERDQLLFASDWAETPSAERRLSPELFEAWASYRQALRDLPQITADPSRPVWPTPPQT